MVTLNNSWQHGLFYTIVPFFKGGGYILCVISGDDQVTKENNFIDKYVINLDKISIWPHTSLCIQLFDNKKTILKSGLMICCWTFLGYKDIFSTNLLIC